MDKKTEMVFIWGLGSRFGVEGGSISRLRMTITTATVWIIGVFYPLTDCP